MSKKENFSKGLNTVNTTTFTNRSKYSKAIKNYVKTQGSARIKAEKQPKDYSSLGRIEPLRIFTIIFAILLLVALIAGLTGTENTRTFSGFLQFLTSFEGIPMDWLKVPDTIIAGDWGIFEFLRNFFELIASFGKIIAWFGISILNALIFILKFVSWLFFGY